MHFDLERVLYSFLPDLSALRADGQDWQTLVVLVLISAAFWGLFLLHLLTRALSGTGAKYSL